MKQSFLKKYDLTPSVSISLIFLIAFFALFLAFPLIDVFKGAFWTGKLPRDIDMRKVNSRSFGPGTTNLTITVRAMREPVPAEWQADITIQSDDAKEEALNLTCGVSLNATPKFDEGVDEAAPPTPENIFLRAAFRAKDKQNAYLIKDFRGDKEKLVWRLLIQSDLAKDISGWTLKWDISNIPDYRRVMLSSRGKFDLTYFALMVTDPIQRACVLNSFKIGLMVTILTTLLSIPLAYFLVRYRFFGRGILQGLILVPMIMPPFVGAIGMKQFFAPYGSINLLLMKLRLMSFENPIDWSGGGFWGVVLLEILHLYPIMYLNVAAALANVDPNLEEAAENLGATKFRLFRTVTFPLMLPGYFAGAIIVFIWSFTDLGTPLIFEYRQVLPVQIFNRVNDIHTNPMGYALVVLVIILTLLFFYLSKKVVGSRRYEMMGRGHTGSREVQANPLMTGIIYLFVGGLIFTALLPHISVFLTSITPKAREWFLTVLPSEVTLRHYGGVFTHDNTLSSIKNSLFYSTLSTLLDIFLGILIAYLLTRKRIPGKNILDTTAMLPLALPGIALAFGYVGCFANTPLNPRDNPTALLIIAYAVRRLPYMVRAAYAGFQQTSITLEEASQNLGASPLRTLRKITLPLVIANLVAGGILCFSFAMLEVSSSLILSMKDQFNPITKTIYELFGRLEDGPYISSAMGILGMVLLTVSLVTAGRFLGKRMGELFRA